MELNNGRLAWVGGTLITPPLAVRGLRRAPDGPQSCAVFPGSCCGSPGGACRPAVRTHSIVAWKMVPGPRGGPNSPCVTAARTWNLTGWDAGLGDEAAQFRRTWPFRGLALLKLLPAGPWPVLRQSASLLVGGSWPPSSHGRNNNNAGAWQAKQGFGRSGAERMAH